MTGKKLTLLMVGVCVLMVTSVTWGSYSSYVNGEYFGYGSFTRGASDRTGKMLTLANPVYSAMGCLGSFSSYQASDLSGWDLQYSAQAGFVDSDFLINTFGTRLNSDTTTMRLGVDAKKDRMVVMTEFHYEYSRGEGTADGMDTRTTGVTVMPGYKLWTQEENGVDVTAFGIFDMGYMNGSTNIAFTTAPNQWRISPGAGVALGYMTPMGLFQAGYTFHNSRNIDGDFEVTGESYMDIHSVMVGMSAPMLETVEGLVALDYTAVEDTPVGLADEFTHVQLGLATLGSKNWKINGRYFESVDSSDNRGFNASVAYMW
jgi:hypothetical protein